MRSAESNVKSREEGRSPFAGGRSLQEEGLSRVAENVTNMIRRNPVPAVLVGLGVGLLLAKITIRS